MKDHRTRRASRVGIFACVVSSTLAACSGGGGSAVAPIRGAAPVAETTPSPAPSPMSSVAQGPTASPQPSRAPSATPIAASPTPAASATPTATPTPASGSATGSLNVAPQLLYVVENQTPTIDFYDPTTLSKVGSFTDVSTSADTFALPTLSPLAVARDGAGNVYVTDRNGYVRKYAAGASGNVKPIAAFSGAKSCFTSYCPYVGLFGVAVDRKNRVIAVGDDGSSNENIVIYAQNANATTLQSPTQIVTTYYTDSTVPLDGLAIDAAGNLFATDLTGGAYAFDAPIPATTAKMSGITAGRRFAYPIRSYPIAVDASGDVFVGFASAGVPKIAMYPPASNAPLLLDYPANAGILDGLAADATGHLYASFAAQPASRDGGPTPPPGQLSLLARYDLGGGAPATAQSVVTLSVAPNGISL